MRALTIALVVLMMMPMSGCIRPGLLPCCIGSMYMQTENAKGLEELHLVIDGLDVHYAGPEGALEGDEFTISQDLDMDIDIARAQDSWAVFVHEDELPYGEYSGFTITVEDAYGVTKSGEHVDVELASMTFTSDETFHITEDAENRAVLNLDGAIERSGGGWTFGSDVVGVTHTFVDNAASGSDVHEVGQLVQLAELQ